MTAFRRWSLPALTLAGAMPLAQAADETGKWYMAPQVGYTVTDHLRAVDDNAFYGLAIGKHVSERWSAELSLDRGMYHGSGDKLDLTSVSFNALRVFARRAPISPYLTGGVGYISDDFNPGPSRGDFLGQVGAGLLIDIAASAHDAFLFQLRPEVKVRWDWNDVGRGHPVGLPGRGRLRTRVRSRTYALDASGSGARAKHTPCGRGACSTRARSTTAISAAACGASCVDRSQRSELRIQFRGARRKRTSDSGSARGGVAASRQPTHHCRGPGPYRRCRQARLQPAALAA